MFKRSVIAFGALALAAGAATAQPIEKKPDAQAGVGDAGAKAKKYCVVNKAPTGSFLDRKICKTRDEWLKDGFDPLAAPKK